MASRKLKLKNDLRHRKVTVYTRPPDLNVILEMDQGQCQTSPNYESQGQGQGHMLEGTDVQVRDQSPQCHTAEMYATSTDGILSTSECTSQSDASSVGDIIADGSDNESPARGQQKQCTVGQAGDELGRLKQYAVKLNLPTRRPSYALWRRQHFGLDDMPVLNMEPSGLPEQEVTWSAERRSHVDATLRAVRKDLRELQSEDQNLASRLLGLRRRIHEIRMMRYTQAHKDMLEEAIFDQIRDPLDDLSDLPPRLFSPVLKHYGVTRMNVQIRRFSVF